MSHDNEKKIRKDTAFWTKWCWDEHAGDTMHLSALEEGVYMRLLRLYYRDYRGPLPDDAKVLARKVLARTEEERQAVGLVLGEFFHKGADGLWHHTRCNKELADAEAFSETRAKGGKAAAGLPRGQGGRFNSRHVLDQARACAGEQPACAGRNTGTEQYSTEKDITEKDITEEHPKEVVVGDVSLVDSSSQYAPPNTKDKSRVGAYGVDVDVAPIHTPTPTNVLSAEGTQGWLTPERLAAIEVVRRGDGLAPSEENALEQLRRRLREATQIPCLTKNTLEETDEEECGE